MCVVDIFLKKKKRVFFLSFYYFTAVLMLDLGNDALQLPQPSFEFEGKGHLFTKLGPNGFQPCG